jgi:type IV secretory pathway VirB3-like protein
MPSELWEVHITHAPPPHTAPLPRILPSASLVVWPLALIGLVICAAATIVLVIAGLAVVAVGAALWLVGYLLSVLGYVDAAELLMDAGEQLARGTVRGVWNPGGPFGEGEPGSLSG